MRLKACWLPTEGLALGERKVMKRDRSQSAVRGTWVFTLTRGYLACYPSFVSQVSPLSNRGDGCYHLSRGPRTKQGLVIIQRRGDQTQEPFSVLKSGAGQADPWFRDSAEQHVEDGLVPMSSWEEDVSHPSPTSFPHLLETQDPRCAGAAGSCQLFWFYDAYTKGVCQLPEAGSGCLGGNRGLRNSLASVSGMELKTNFVFVGSESLCLVARPCPIV